MNLYGIGKNLCKVYLNLFFKVEAIGLENIPKDGGVLLCCNHISNNDPPLLGTTCQRKVHFMAKEQMFKGPFKPILFSLGAFPVRRGMSDKKALKEGLRILKEGKVLGLFPEGTRSKDGKLGKGNAGAGFFALKSEAKVVPSAIIGSYKRGQKIKIVYGEPIDFSDLKGQSSASHPATERIMQAIQKLIEDHNC